MKAPDAFRTISEVAEDLDLPQHVLRFWETRFTQIKPMKRGGGRRYYRPEDVELLRGIRILLYSEGFTIRGVQRLLKEKGLAYVAGFGRGGTAEAGAPVAARPEHPPEPDDADADEFSLPSEDDEAEPETAAPQLRQERDLRADPGFAPLPEPRLPVIEEAAPSGPASASPMQVAAVAWDGPSPADRRRVEAALADLLEAKRLLDQVR